ncbi:NAD(P)H-dependent oxidoreductase [Chloroflexota bacterium]
MFQLNKCLKELDAKGSPIRTSLVGAGSTGSSVVGQIIKAPGMQIDVVVDIKIENAINALIGARVTEKHIAVCDSIEDAEEALKDGKKICSTNLEIACGMKPIQVVVDATGVPAAYAHIALNAIRNKKHVVTFTVEGDVCIGHILKMFADNAGVVYTGIYGDEPGNMMALYCEATALGFDIVAVGRSDVGGSKLEWNPETAKDFLTSTGMIKWQRNPIMFASFCDGSKTNEECCMMANATGLKPDIRGMHGPYVSFEEFRREVPRLLQLKEDGGILNSTGVVECIKPPGDPTIATSAGFVWTFVVVRTTNRIERIRMQMGQELKGVSNRLFYSCENWVAIQAPITIAVAALDHRAVIAPEGNKRAADVITMAKKDLQAGEVIDEIGGFCTAGRIEVASIVRKDNLLPFALATGAKVRRDVTKGDFLTYDDVELPDSQSLIVQLRNLQQSLFGDLH